MISNNPFDSWYLELKCSPDVSQPCHILSCSKSLIFSVTFLAVRLISSNNDNSSSVTSPCTSTALNVFMTFLLANHFNGQIFSWPIWNDLSQSEVWWLDIFSSENVNFELLTCPSITPLNSANELSLSSSSLALGL